MDRLRDILDAHPAPASSAGEAALKCIYEAAQCALVCVTCADACLAEPDGFAGKASCVRLALDCVESCSVVARLLASAGDRDHLTLRLALDTCVRACVACADECGRHGSMEHCVICAETCRACAHACEEMRSLIVP